MDPKTTPTWIWISCSALVALVVGVLIGRGTSSSGDASNEQSAAGSAGESATLRPTARGGEGSATASRSDRGPARELTGDARRARLESILQSSSRLKRTQELLAFLEQVPAEEMTAVYDQMRNAPNAELRESERSLVLQAWAERDPMSAVAYLQENGADDWERETTLSTWASVDPQAAFDWANDAEDEGRINNWVLGAMEGIAATSPELGRDFLMQMEDDRTRRRSLGAMQDYVTQYGFEYAEGWINGIEEGDLKNRASRYLADNLTEMDPQRAGEWTMSIEDRDTRRHVSEDVAEDWARNDFESAKTWVEGLPADTQSEAAEGIAEEYGRNNPEEGAEWLASLGDNPDLDGARHDFIQESFDRDPELSLNFVENLNNERWRDRTYGHYIEEWMEEDQNAALAWAQENQAKLSNEVIEEINEEARE